MPHVSAFSFQRMKGVNRTEDLKAKMDFYSNNASYEIIYFSSLQVVLIKLILIFVTIVLAFYV